MSTLVENFELSKDDFVVIAGNFNNFIMKEKRKNRNYDLNFLIDEIIDKIGTSGTLMFHTFSWDFCHNIKYDIKNTRSKTGALGNIALQRDDFKRTKHPIYSFAVFGKWQENLVKMDNKSSFSYNSPFAFMHKNRAKMIIVNMELNHSFTFVHYVEQSHNINYRFEKDFSGIFIDENGIESRRIYSMFVRKDGVFTDLNPLEKIFVDKKAMKIKYTLNEEIKLIDLNLTYDIISDDIRQNQAKNLYVKKF
ncbi:AAC(3) family N-acetyltransferase [Campylobacter sputorum]|uniref:AAC(3) family N-acetyltransferase n=1 Tax=Campylobacter sputorum TaxID=206 RepID=UPI000B7903EB|nr:AAC(3) family N-acetyltransferase [Campylobacter sputorum]ASM37148.1 putative aminoglycoside N3'-acetyltransferase [Campylobacter sputorum bv. faecalis CCUG 20703]